MSVDDYWAEAKRIIAKAIENAVKHVAAGLEEVEADDDNIKVADYWPLGNQADEHTGLSAIETFIKEWERGNEWKYFIKYLGKTDDKLHFEVRWSIPTRRKPIPRATASVYFTLWIHNENEQIETFYVFEGHRLVHRPGKPQFREIWLKNIIDSKLKVLETLGDKY